MLQSRVSTRKTVAELDDENATITVKAKSESDKFHKIILVGPPGVGKTNILRTLQEHNAEDIGRHDKSEKTKKTTVPTLMPEFTSRALI